MPLGLPASVAVPAAGAVAVAAGAAVCPPRGWFLAESVPMLAEVVASELPVQTLGAAGVLCLSLARSAPPLARSALRAAALAAALAVLRLLSAAPRARAALHAAAARPVNAPPSGLDAANADEAEDHARSTARVLWESIVSPFHFTSKDVRRLADVPYGPDSLQTLDLYVPREKPAPGARMPVLLYVHGGGWTHGDKIQPCGRALVSHMATKGWVGASMNYRLAPRHRFPANLCDVKRAIAFLRKNAEKYHLDPDFIVLSGGSAGGHLATLATLTPNVPEYQTGFEDVDTNVQGCVSFYGVYDVTPSDAVPFKKRLSAMDKTKLWLNDWLHFEEQKHRLSRFWKAVILPRESVAHKSDLAEHLAVASPTKLMEQRIEKAVMDGTDPATLPKPPPLFIIHGASDALVSAGQARSFVEACLGKEGLEHIVPQIHYAQLDFGHHAFDAVHGVRLRFAIDAIETFLGNIRASSL